MTLLHVLHMLSHSFVIVSAIVMRSFEISMKKKNRPFSFGPWISNWRVSCSIPKGHQLVRGPGNRVFRKCKWEARDSKHIQHDKESLAAVCALSSCLWFEINLHCFTCVTIIGFSCPNIFAFHRILPLSFVLYVRTKPLTLRFCGNWSNGFIIETLVGFVEFIFLL